MVIKRVTIIRQINEVIKSVCKMPDDEEEDEEEEKEGNDEESLISFKKLVKIMNLCQVYVPLIQQKENDSTYMSFDISDMMELQRSKEAYKHFVQLQADSLEQIMKKFQGEDPSIDCEQVSSFLNLMTNFCIKKNNYYLSILQSSCLLTTLFATHLQINRQNLRTMYFEKV